MNFWLVKAVYQNMKKLKTGSRVELDAECGAYTKNIPSHSIVRSGICRNNIEVIARDNFY